VTRLANACETPLEKIIVWTLLDTGLRVSELASLAKDNINWQLHRLTIFGKVGPYGKNSKRRVVPMTDRIQPLLESYFAFNDSFGYTERHLSRIVKAVANRARIKRPVSPHVLRHTFAVTAIQKGVSLPALQRVLGHDDLSTTQIYLNLSPEEALNEFKRKW
jgi:integrase/recombinase XerD